MRPALCRKAALYQREFCPLYARTYRSPSTTTDQIQVGVPYVFPSSRKEHATSIPGLTLYRRTDTTACYPATYEPSFNVFVQGKKRITLSGTSYLCDGSTFLLSSLDLPVVSQIVEACEEVPLLSMLLKLDMSVVREILNHAEFQSANGSSDAPGLAIGKTTVDLLKPTSRLLDLLDAPEDIPFLSSLIQREIVYRLLRGPQGAERVSAPSPQWVTRATERLRRLPISEPTTRNLCV
jgi:AraC-type transcriptional regulator N-terminus